MRVFITGASSGLGLALAQAYAARGATLGLVARTPARPIMPGDTLAGAHFYSADVRNTAAIRDAASRFMADVGIPDVVIACAGISHGTQTDYPQDSATFQEIVDINLVGMVKTFQLFVTLMRQIGHGQLVGISSVAGVRGLPGAGAYSASKAAVSKYLESLRVELHGSGVNVLDVSPGYIKTPMTAHNPYRMPFMMEASDAAERILRAIRRRRTRVVIPWQMAFIAKVLAVLPSSWYDPLFAQAPRKPRKV